MDAVMGFFGGLLEGVFGKDNVNDRGFISDSTLGEISGIKGVSDAVEGALDEDYSKAALGIAEIALSKFRAVKKAIDRITSKSSVRANVPPAPKTVEVMPKPGKGAGTVAAKDRDPKRVFSPRQKAERLAEQDGTCASCGKPIDKGIGHHKTRHADGGTTTMDNLAIVCESCHIEIHR